ncbi:MAG: hypothetical protein N2317_08535 [Syntrophales bacterium]|nr:hypothetical protein [Syntrophales bacterium]
MASQKTLDKNYTVKDGGVVIVETVQKNLSKEELLQEKMNLINRQAQISRQMADIQAQYDNIGNAVTEIDLMIAAIDGPTKTE